MNPPRNSLTYIVHTYTYVWYNQHFENRNFINTSNRIRMFSFLYSHLSLAMLIDVSTFLLGIGRSNEFFLILDNIINDFFPLARLFSKETITHGRNWNISITLFVKAEEKRSFRMKITYHLRAGCWKRFRN
jgi:hypothetical protein